MIRFIYDLLNLLYGVIRINICSTCCINVNWQQYGNQEQKTFSHIELFSIKLRKPRILTDKLRNNILHQLNHCRNLYLA